MIVGSGEQNKEHNKVRDTALGEGCKVSKASGEQTFPQRQGSQASPRESG